MLIVKRYQGNPILSPDKERSWEAEATFNGCVVKNKNKYHLVYRAISSRQYYYGANIELSSIGCAESKDGVNFSNRKILITPEYKWKQFGCEDPRVTKMGGKYYIFYTAVSWHQPTPADIKVGVAITKNFEHIEEEHQVTNFNSKAMALFPEKINNKYVVILTANTDRPPARVALAFFDRIKHIWSFDYWNNWYAVMEKNSLSLQRRPEDHVEIGAVPIKTNKGWLLIYSYIKNYLSPPAVFGIEAVLLDLKNPLEIIGRTKDPFLVPEERYELYGKVPNVIFPSGALIDGDDINIYYGAADTTLCLAKVKLRDLVSSMITKRKFVFIKNKPQEFKLERYSGNPILRPNPRHSWESVYVFNPGATFLEDKVHLLYRAMGADGTSVLGYASLKDGFRIDERLPEPAYIPREDFEKKVKEGNSGCEDPRLTVINDKLYMCYTAFDGVSPTKVALTSIKVDDFLQKKWNWEKPAVISDPARSDKNACLFPEKFKENYAFFHRIGGCIWLDFVDDLDFAKHKLGGKIILSPRSNKWDSRKIGIAGPPIKTPLGWLLIYHGLSLNDDKYRLGAALLNLEKPDKVLCRLDYPIIEPEVHCENIGFRPGTVFSCGAAVLKGRLIVYYGGADEVVCIAYCSLKKLLLELKKYKI